MKMVEKMARAIAEVEFGKGCPVTNEYRKSAIAALKALRENSDDLLEAGIRAKEAHYAKMQERGENTRTVLIADHPAGTIFDAMIDAAIAEAS